MAIEYPIHARVAVQLGSNRAGTLSTTRTSTGGNVGKVGSVTEKAAAARRAGARYFLVPSGQAEEARRGGGPKLKVISVSTLDGTLTALEALGGDASAVKWSCERPPAVEALTAAAERA